jgi:hypothetical protein
MENFMENMKYNNVIMSKIEHMLEANQGINRNIVPQQQFIQQNPFGNFNVPNNNLQLMQNIMRNMNNVQLPLQLQQPIGFNQQQAFGNFGNNFVNQNNPFQGWGNQNVPNNFSGFVNNF